MSKYIYTPLGMAILSNFSFHDAMVVFRHQSQAHLPYKLPQKGNNQQQRLEFDFSFPGNGWNVKFGWVGSDDFPDFNLGGFRRIHVSTFDVNTSNYNIVQINPMIAKMIQSI